MERCPTVPAVHTFAPLTLDHAESHPITFDTKAQLKSYCDKKGLVHPAL